MDQLKLEELASVNNIRQMRQNLRAGEAGRWQTELLKIITMSPCMQLLCTYCAPLSPTGNKEWHNMHLWERGESICSTGMMIALFFVGWGLPVLVCSPHQCWKESAVGESKCCSRTMNTDEKGKRSPNLCFTTCLQLWWCFKGVTYTGIWIWEVEFSLPCKSQSQPVFLTCTVQLQEHVMTN